MEASDLAVVARVRAGDNDAFRLLVERHSRTTFRLAYRLTGHEHDAEDVVQETFLRAFRQIGQFQARSSFATWLYRIAVNCAHDLLRQRPRHASARSFDDANAEQIEVVDQSAGADPHKALVTAEVGHRLHAALADLSDQERSAFVLRHYEGLSIEEIGHALGLRTSATKHSVFRAVKKLRRSMEPLLGVEP